MKPLPAGFGIALDPSVQRFGNMLLGGDPVRAMRLSDAGRAAVDCLVSGSPNLSAGTRQLARRLVDAGMAHPRPPATPDPPDVTVVIPVRDRPVELARCLQGCGSGFPIVVVDDGSADPARIAAVAAAHGATVIPLASSAGPAAARNAALATIDSALVAFVDSDCRPDPGWIEALVAHFADPCVAAVAPRVLPPEPAGGAGTLERFAAARSPIDLGPSESAVVPGRRVSYVPTAALLVRRAAIGRGFEPALRHGEDVDLVWRLHDAGWTVRYDPTVRIRHAEPPRWRDVLGRRLRYGTSAAPLARRHPGRLAPLVAPPAPLATALLLLARRPGLALASIAVQTVLVDGRTRRLGLPRRLTLRWSVVSAGWMLVGLGRAATIIAGPALLLGLLNARTRSAAAALLVAAPLKEWRDRRPDLDPARWTVACIADDGAYGLGVWWGCLKQRTWSPLLPRVGQPR